MKIYRLAYFAAGFCAHASFIEASRGDAWWSLLFAALVAANIYVAAKNEPRAQ